MQIAVVADIHLHDLHGGYGILEEASGEVALRTLSDMMASTRVFNESHAAFLAVLDDIVTRGIRDVVLLGDYSDDGQVGAVVALKKILSFYEDTHGMRFFLTFGNHDCFGPLPRNQAKWLTMRDGLNPVLVTSDKCAIAPANIQPGMLGMSSSAAMESMGRYGVRRPENVAYWETPPGTLESSRSVDLDTSYLVEPQDGLWLLMLDANVFHEIDGAWHVRADAAWDYVLAERPYLLEWISDVVDRAALLGKTLLAFSHYPMLPLALTGKGENLRSACAPDWQARMPSLKSSQILAKAGLRWHFSGHMHVAARTELGGLVNVAVPSPIAYPGGYVIVTVDNGVVGAETMRLQETTGFDVGFFAYKNQIGGDNKLEFPSILTCLTYPDFLRSHLLHLVATKHTPNDWPSDLLSYLDQPIASVFVGSAGLSHVIGNWKSVVSQPFRVMAEDYYILRANHEAAGTDIPVDRCEFYSELGYAFGARSQVQGHSESDMFLELFFACFTPPSAAGGKIACRSRG